MGEACLMSVSVFAVGCFALSSGNVYACIVSVQEINESASRVVVGAPRQACTELEPSNVRDHSPDKFKTSHKLEELVTCFGDTAVPFLTKSRFLYQVPTTLKHSMN